MSHEGAATSDRPTPTDVKSIAIVGGGAGGLIAAHQLLAGEHAGDYEITIFERNPEAYTTLCGEGISHTSLERFTAFDSFPYVAHEFVGARWFFPGDVQVDVEQRGYTIERSTWIPAMAESAQALGAEYITGQKLTPRLIDGLASEYDLVVGADGPGSQVRASMHDAEITTVLGMQYRVAESDYETDRLEFYTDKTYTPEYAWIFPKDGIQNVGLLATGDGKDLDRLDQFMADKGVGGKVVKTETYPIGFFGTKVLEGNKVLIGDAGGLTNPVTKGGLTAIVYATEILAEVVASGEVATYHDRIMSHPIMDPSFKEALRIITSWSNEDFERLARFAPHRMQVGDDFSAKLRYLGPLLLTLLANPGKARDLYVLQKAMGLSRLYSW